jgi:CRP/FNR family transcriptional regulator, cyclic AMP receptor protein
MILNESFGGKFLNKLFEKGSYLYRQDQTARFLFEIVSGEIAITNVNDQGKEFIQNIYRAGDCFGIASLICDKTYTASALAQKDCEINLLPKELFFQSMKNDPEFHYKITHTLARQLLYKTMMLEEVANEEGEHRLLTLIHYLMAQKAQGNKALDTTKQQLADMTGLRVETVIRILKRLEEKGKIASERGKIVCLSKNI